MTKSRGDGDEPRFMTSGEYAVEMLGRYAERLRRRAADTDRFIDRQQALIDKLEAKMKEGKKLIRRTPPGHISDRSDW